MKSLATVIREGGIYAKEIKQFLNESDKFFKDFAAKQKKLKQKKT